MLRIKLLTAAATTALLVAPAAFAQTAPAPPAPTQTAPAATPASAENVIDVLKAHGQFTTLLQALDQAQLTETLATRPAITLFAPTDAAFAALPEAERTRLLDPANAQELRNLLLYHVLVTDLTTEQIKGAAGPVPTAGGAEIQIDGTQEAIAYGSASVIQAEIDASNGGIFPIGAVLNPANAAQGDAEAAPVATPSEAPATGEAEAAADAAAAGVTAPSGEPAAAVTTTASPPVENPTDGQVDATEDPANPAPTPN